MDENNQIAELNTEAETILSQIRAKSSEIEGIASELKAISDNVKSEVIQSKTKVDSKVGEIETKVNEISTKEGSIDTLVRQAEVKTSEIENLNQKLIELKTKIEDSATGVDAVLVKINADNVVVAEKVLEAKNLVDNINMLSQSSTTLDEQINENKKQIEGYKKEIEMMYGFITGSGLSHSFSERKDELQGKVTFWQWVTIISVLILGGILCFIYKHPLNSGSNWIEMFLYKITYSSPGIFLVWFSALQYSRVQRLMESYAFKAATAKALENYTEVLERRFGDVADKKDILGFVLASMKDIYQHPNKDDLTHEDKEVEQNAMVNIDSVLKNLGEKIIDPINTFLDKVRKAKE